MFEGDRWIDCIIFKAIEGATNHIGTMALLPSCVTPVVFGRHPQNSKSVILSLRNVTSHFSLLERMKALGV